MILSLDPGTEQTAWMLFDGTPIAFGIEENQSFLDSLYFDKKWDAASQMVYEMIACQGMAVGRETFETVLWIGRFDEAWRINKKVKPEKLYRQDCKLHLCGSNRAKDANIRQALIDLYGASKEKAIGKKANPGPLYGVSSHCWSALAVARTFWDTKRGKP